MEGKYKIPLFFFIHGGGRKKNKRQASKLESLVLSVLPLHHTYFWLLEMSTQDSNLPQLNVDAPHF